MTTGLLSALQRLWGSSCLVVLESNFTSAELPLAVVCGLCQPIGKDHVFKLELIWFI